MFRTRALYANVSIAIYGDNGDDSGNSKKMVNLFEKGQRDFFTLECLFKGNFKDYVSNMLTKD